MLKKIKDYLKKKRIYWTIRRSGLFDREYYLRTNLDVARSCMNPIKHYIHHGWHEGRNPNQIFDTKWYLKTYLSVAKAGINPLYHYLKHGAGEGRDPSATFSARKYLTSHPDAVKSGLNPLSHFLKYSKGSGQTGDGFIIPNPVNTGSNAIPRKLAYTAKVNETMSADLVQEIHSNIRKELFDHK